MIRALRTTITTLYIIVMVATFEPQANLAKLQSTRNTFVHLTLIAYRKRTNFGPATNRVQKYHCLG